MIGEKKLKIYAECIPCQLNRQMRNIQNQTDEEKKLAYIKSVCEIMAQMETRYSSPVALEKINKSYIEFFGEPYSYEKEKEDFDNLLLSFEDDIRKKINSSSDPLLLAVKYAGTGNLIDFGIYRDMTREQFLELLSAVDEEELNEQTFCALKNDLDNAKSLVYLLDNCGESVLDKLLIETIICQYPSLDINVIVRGSPVLNDVTLADAQRIGLDKLVTITENGTGIPGTQLDRINAYSRELIDNADVIISKGQGNFETLQGCGLNIYYLLLCKCDLFVRLFNAERNSKIFVNERTFTF